MNNIINLPNYDKLLYNFHHCINWEEKYLYIIELGNFLSAVQKKKGLKKYLIPSCQSKVWVSVQIINTNNQRKIVELYGNSDSAIMKGVLCIIFIIYKGFTLEKFITFNPYPFLNQLKLTEHLTYSRSQGIKSILNVIHSTIKEYKI